MTTNGRSSITSGGKWSSGTTPARILWIHLPSTASNSCMV